MIQFLSTACTFSHCACPSSVSDRESLHSVVSFRSVNLDMHVIYLVGTQASPPVDLFIWCLANLWTESGLPRDMSSDRCIIVEAQSYWTLIGDNIRGPKLVLDRGAEGRLAYKSPLRKRK